MGEYGITQKGLDAIDRIIKKSPQYKALIQRFLEVLWKYPYERREYERERYIRYHAEKWEKELKELKS